MKTSMNKKSGFDPSPLRHGSSSGSSYLPFQFFIDRDSKTPKEKKNENLKTT